MMRTAKRIPVDTFVSRFVLSAFVLVAAASPAQKQPSQIYREASPAVVVIEGTKKVGSGFLISDDGIVVTNFHVVSGETSVSIRFAGGLELVTDDVVASDPDLDVVLLRLKGKDFQKVPMGDSDHVVPGDEVEVISNPLGLEGSITNGL